MAEAKLRYSYLLLKHCFLVLIFLGALFFLGLGWTLTNPALAENYSFTWRCPGCANVGMRTSGTESGFSTLGACNIARNNSLARARSMGGGFTASPCRGSGSSGPSSTYGGSSAPTQTPFQKYVEKGYKNWGSNKFKSAIKAFQNALDYKNDPYIRFQLAYFLALRYADREKENEALGHCQILKRQNYTFLSNYCSAKYYSTIYRSIRRGFNSSLDYYQEDDPLLQNALDDLSTVIDNFEPLQSIANPHITGDKNSSLYEGALYLYAQLLLYDGRAAGALFYIKQAQNLAPWDRDLANLEALALSKMGRFSESEMIWRNIIDTIPKKIGQWKVDRKAFRRHYQISLAYTLVRQGKYREALEIYDEIDKKKKKNANIYIRDPYYAAVAAFEFGNYDQAEKYIKWAEERKTNPEIYGRKIDPAEKYYTYSYTPYKNQVTVLQGKILMAQGRVDEARQLDPNNPTYLASLDQDSSLIEAETVYEQAEYAAGHGGIAADKAGNISIADIDPGDPSNPNLETSMEETRDQASRVFDIPVFNTKGTPGPIPEPGTPVDELPEMVKLALEKDPDYQKLETRKGTLTWVREQFEKETEEIETQFNEGVISQEEYEIKKSDNKQDLNNADVALATVEKKQETIEDDYVSYFIPPSEDDENPNAESVGEGG